MFFSNVTNETEIELRQELRCSEKMDSEMKAPSVRRRKRSPTKPPRLRLSIDEESKALQMRTAGQEFIPSTSDDDKPKPAMTTLGCLILRVYHLCTPRRFPWLSKASRSHTVPSHNGLFSALAIITVVSSTGFTSLSMTKNENPWERISQMILSIFQAYCAYVSRHKSAKRRGDEDDSRHLDIVPASRYFCQYMVAGALSAIVSACVYPYNTHVSIFFGFVANLCQVAGIISIRNATDGSIMNRH